jgi:hypothetical protein
VTTDHDVVVADDLDAAADVIDARGWCQNGLVTSDGRVCAEGAILAAVTGAERLEFAGAGSAGEWLEAAAVAIPEDYRRYGGRIRGALGVLRDRLFRETCEFSVHYWNDRSYMTRDEVTDMFRRAAKDARERAGGAS